MALVGHDTFSKSKASFTMSADSYNGWTNYETQNVKLWLNKNQSASDYWKKVARECFDNAEADKTFTQLENASFDLRDKLKNQIEDENPLIDQASMWSDLLGAAISEVKWQEIAENFLSSVDAMQSCVSRWCGPCHLSNDQ